MDCAKLLFRHRKSLDDSSAKRAKHPIRMFCGHTSQDVEIALPITELVPAVDRREYSGPWLYDLFLVHSPFEQLIVALHSGSQTCPARDGVFELRREPQLCFSAVHDRPSSLEFFKEHMRSYSAIFPVVFQITGRLFCNISPKTNSAGQCPVSCDLLTVVCWVFGLQHG